MSLISTDKLKQKAKDALGAKLDEAKNKAKSYAEGAISEAVGKVAGAGEGAISKAVGAKAAEIGKLAESAKRNQGKEVTKSVKPTAKEKITNLASGKLATPFYEKGPKEDTLTKDPLGVTEALSINKGSAAAKQATDSVADTLKGSVKDLASLAKNIVSTKNGKLSVDLDGFKDRAKDLLGGRVKDQLISGVANAFTGPGGLDGLKDRALTLVTDNVKQKVNSLAKDSLESISTSLNKLVNDSQFSKVVDQPAKNVSVSGLFSEALKKGASSLVTKTVDKLGDDPAATFALKTNLKSITESGDLGLVNKAIEKLGKGYVTNQIPDIASMLASNFKIPEGTPERELKTVGDEFSDLLAFLKPNWDTITVDQVDIGDITAFRKASPDAKKVFATDPAKSVSLALSSFYWDIDPRTDLSTRYPNLTLMPTGT